MSSQNFNELNRSQQLADREEYPAARPARLKRAIDTREAWVQEQLSHDNQYKVMLVFLAITWVFIILGLFFFLLGLISGQGFLTILPALGTAEAGSLILVLVYNTMANIKNNYWSIIISDQLDRINRTNRRG